MTLAKNNFMDEVDGDFGRFEETIDQSAGEYTLEGFLASHIARLPARGVRGEILYFNKGQDLLEQIACVGFGETVRTMRARFIRDGDFEGQGLCAYAAMTGTSVLVADVRRDKRYKAVQGEKDHTLSELVIPLKKGQDLVGILNLESDEIAAFEEEHQAYFERISPIAALLIEYETFKIGETFLTRALADISKEPDLEVIVTKILDHVLTLMGPYTYGCVLKPLDHNEESGMMKVVVSTGLRLKSGEHIDMGSLGVIRRAWQGKTSSCYWSEDEGTARYTQIDAGQSIRSEFSLALKVAGRTLAVMDIESESVAISERFQRAIERLTSHGAALLYALEEKGRAERREGANAVLMAVDHEMHNAAGMFGILLNEVRRQTEELSPRMIKLSQGIHTRFRKARTMMNSFLGSSGPVKLGRVLVASERFAQQVDVALTVRNDLPGLVINGNEAGFRWLFENLILNSKSHGPDALGKKAWITVSQDEERLLLQYWDNGQAPEDVDNFLERKTKRRGVKHIKMLCQRYNWVVAVARHENGSLTYRFAFK